MIPYSGILEPTNFDKNTGRSLGCEWWIDGDVARRQKLDEVGGPDKRRRKKRRKGKGSTPLPSWRPGASPTARTFSCGRSRPRIAPPTSPTSRKPAGGLAWATAPARSPSFAFWARAVSLPGSARPCPTSLSRRGRVHSEKPLDAYRRLERLFPGPRLDLFARRRIPGWWAWGDELGPRILPPPQMTGSLTLSQADYCGRKLHRGTLIIRCRSARRFDRCNVRSHNQTQCR